MANRSTPAPYPDLSRLTSREAHILEMVSRGLTNAQIASHLQVSVHAVKFHLASVYRKLGVANRTEAASTFLRSALAMGVEPGSAGS